MVAFLKLGSVFIFYGEAASGHGGSLCRYDRKRAGVAGLLHFGHRHLTIEFYSHKGDFSRGETGENATVSLRRRLFEISLPPKHEVGEVSAGYDFPGSKSRFQNHLLSVTVGVRRRKRKINPPRRRSMTLGWIGRRLRMGRWTYVSNLLREKP